MLKSLSISNLAVIANVTIEFEKGLNILTGETGAGKSIIIDAINLVLGDRFSKDMIRSGEARARVEALFEIDDSFSARLNDMGIESEGELLITREMTSDGKNTVRINGGLSTSAILKTVGMLLINIHGQHDSQLLLDSSKHLDILDRFAQTEQLRSRYGEVFEELKSIRKQIETLTEDSRERERKAEFLRYEAEMIENAHMEEGEYERLTELSKMMANSRKIADNAAAAYSLVYENYEGASAAELIGNALKKLEEISSFSEKIAAVRNSLSQVYYSLEDVCAELGGLSEEIDFDEETVNETERRIDELNALRKRFGNTYEEITDYYKKISDELFLLTNTEENTRKLNVLADEKEEELIKIANELSEKRKKAALKLEKNIITELADLNMPNARFSVSFTPANKFLRDGIEYVEFLISVNPGIEPGKLSKIASGGELSRVMLCISSALMGKYDVDTVIYDEIDSGVSGRAAQKIAEKLWRVSKDRQVLSVTHLPQIAAMADSHFLIEKDVSGKVAKTSVSLLDNEGRIKEIARIIGGVSINETTLSGAEDMLEQSERFKKE